MFKAKVVFIYLKLIKYHHYFYYFVTRNLFRLGKIKFSETPSLGQLLLVRGEGKITVGKNCLFGIKRGGYNYKGVIEFQPREKNSQIIIEDDVQTNNNLFICAANKIVISSKTLIGQNVTIMDFEAHGIDPSKRSEIGKIGEIFIGRNVWIGNDVVILKNSSIGDNSIVAVGSVVSGKFPANVIIGGVPAKIIREITN
ncbi:maltose O-acetyltransferase [Chryseobacterium ureilyticum]|uniref:Maltose O-acetyltransferase n=1 Tax=Chryseobacterium ureilyticum TaxID=373668 RepID=A0A1N7LXG3_9FLAO|nr:acyltransferase [Chryseobacterium ureilyticum]SIS78401.1 maltose O-acetyltransferase [Chryseobacterium ureilyticum]